VTEIYNAPAIIKGLIIHKIRQKLRKRYE